jgi:hypothetical protein
MVAPLGGRAPRADDASRGAKRPAAHRPVRRNERPEQETPYDMANPPGR